MGYKKQTTIFHHFKKKFSIACTQTWAQFFLLLFSSYAGATHSFYEIATIGAPITGPLLEGSVGAKCGRLRNRFYSQNEGPTIGFVGQQTFKTPLVLKDQPGIFPAPLMGPASLNFVFSMTEEKGVYSEVKQNVIPVLVKPDGTICKGSPLTAEDSPQTIMIPSPAQTGMYTLFVLPNLPNQENAQEGLKEHLSHAKIHVTGMISTRPGENRNLELTAFSLEEKNLEGISAEFVYNSF